MELRRKDAIVKRRGKTEAISMRPEHLKKRGYNAAGWQVMNEFSAPQSETLRKQTKNGNCPAGSAGFESFHRSMIAHASKKNS